MREDMDEVIIERPRYGGGYHRDKKHRINEDTDLPSKESMTMPYNRHYHRKELNENLAPLRRFLKSRVGRKWDDVYSEICERINVNSAVQAHIKEHIDGFVEKQVKIIDGVPHSFNQYHYAHMREEWSPIARETYGKLREHLYVDPEDGNLKVIRDKRKPKGDPKPPFKVPGSETEFYDLIKGHWYLIKTKWMENYGSWRVIKKNGDDYLRYGTRRIFGERIETKFVDGQYVKVPYKTWLDQRLGVVEKKQLSKKVLKQLRAKNIIK